MLDKRSHQDEIAVFNLFKVILILSLTSICPIWDINICRTLKNSPSNIRVMAICIINNKEISEYFKSNNKLSEKIIKDFNVNEGIAVDLFKDNYEITANNLKEHIHRKHFIYITPNEKVKVKDTPPKNMENDSLLELNYYEYLKNGYYNKGDLFNAIIVSANIIEHVLNKKLNPNLFFKNLSVLFDELLVTKRLKEFKFFEKKVISFF